MSGGRPELTIFGANRDERQVVTLFANEAWLGRYSHVGNIDELHSGPSRADRAGFVVGKEFPFHLAYIY
jgi:hypothetical protein